MNNKDRVHLVFRISKEIKAKLYKLAEENHRTMTGQIEYMIEKECKDENQS